MNASKMAVAALVAILLAAGEVAEGDVFNMGGTQNPDGTWTGLASLESVPVGNPGNAGEWSGESYGGHGPDRICGAVPYEYRIGKYEVTAGQYTEFLNAVAATDTYGLYNTFMDYDAEPLSAGCNIKRTGSSGSFAYSVAYDWANRPVNWVSWGDAARFANWLHNGQPTGAQNLSTTEDGAYYLNGATSDEALLAVTRKATWKWVITSEDEWYKAAYYKGGSPNAGYWDYPTKSDTAPSNVGSDGYTDPGNHANFANNGYTIGPPYYRTNVGEFENSASAYGTFDQGGNVREFNEATPYKGSAYAYRGLRGASFCGFYAADLFAASRFYCPPSAEHYAVGFRVSEVPEPASMALLALGGLVILKQSRRT